MFAVAGAILVMQVALSRLLSVVVSYHSAFLVASLAMLGLTASAIDAYAKKLRDPEAFDEEGAARAAGRGGLILAASLLVMMQAGRSDALAMPGAVVGVLGVLGAFHQGGYVVAFLLDRYSADVSRVYFADLVGAAAGCGVAVALLGFLPAPAVMLACAAAIAASGLLLEGRKAFPLAATLVVATATVLSTTTPLYRLHRAKDESQAGVLSEHWNRLARVTVIDSTPGMERSLAILRKTREVTEAQAEQLRKSWRLGWGASERYTGQVPATRWIQLDADAGTAIVEGGATADLGFLEWDVTSAGHHLRRDRIDRAFVIGGGGGRDVLTALRFGARQVDVVEINPSVVEVVRHEFPEFVRAPVYDDPRVSLTVGEGRSVLARSGARYDLIQMSLVDTWASSLAGAMVMSENTLYTREAFREYVSHLDDDGILTVSRWYDPGADRSQRGATWAETMRLARMAATSLREAGIERPEDHVALVYARGFLGSGVCTVIASRSPLGDGDRAALQGLVDRQGYQVLWPLLPGAEDDGSNIGGLLREEPAVVGDPRFDLSVPTDERPFFFNVRRPFSSWAEAWREGDPSIGSPATGMFAAALLFLGALGLVLVTRPLRDLDVRIPLAPAVYFGGLGVGFMAIEMALIQRYIVFLGHPTYALSVVLAVLLLGSGIGSAISGRWSNPSRLIPRVVAGIVVTTLVSAFVLPHLLHATIQLSLAGRVAMAVAGIAPQALFMGMMWPLGVRLLGERGLGEATPWMWATNGFLGVLASVLAVFFATVWGYTSVLLLAAGAYVVSAGAARRQW
jgi:hypothetical protein